MKRVAALQSMILVLIFSIGIAPQKLLAESPAPSVKSTLHQKLKSDPSQIETRQSLAYIYYQEKDYAETIKLLEGHTDKLSRKGRYLLSFAYKEKGDHLNEIRMLQFLIATDKNDTRALTALGNAYLNQNKTTDAILQFRTALEIDKTYRDAYQGLIAAFEGQKNRYELRIIYHDMITLFGKEAQFLSQLCKLYSEDAFFSKATEFCNEAILKDPKNPDNHVHLALSLKDTGGEERALKILENTAKRFPSSVSTQMNYAKMLKEQNNFVGSYKHYKSAAESEGSSPESWVSFAEAAFKLQKYQEALAYFHKACDKNRSFIKNFHVATTELRRNQQSEWYQKYSELQQSCDR